MNTIFNPQQPFLSSLSGQLNIHSTLHIFNKYTFTFISTTLNTVETFFYNKLIFPLSQNRSACRAFQMSNKNSFGHFYFYLLDFFYHLNIGELAMQNIRFQPIVSFFVHFNIDWRENSLMRNLHIYKKSEEIFFSLKIVELNSL